MSTLPTTKEAITLAIGRPIPGKASLTDVENLRAYFRCATVQVRFGSGNLIDYGSVAIDADQMGFETSPNASDESFTAAAILEGLVPCVIPGFSVRANAVLWPRYGGKASDHRRYWELEEDGLEAEAAALRILLPLDSSEAAAMSKRREVIAALVRRHEARQRVTPCNAVKVSLVPS